MNSNPALNYAVMPTDTLLGLGGGVKRNFDKLSVDVSQGQPFSDHFTREDKLQQSTIDRSARADADASVDRQQDRANEIRAERKESLKSANRDKKEDIPDEASSVIDRQPANPAVENTAHSPDEENIASPSPDDEHTPPDTNDELAAVAINDLLNTSEELTATAVFDQAVLDQAV